jgi:hypothetical protein
LDATSRPLTRRASIASVAAGGRSLGTDRERRELTRGKTVGMQELDVQMEGLRVFDFGLAVRRMPLQAGGRMRGESFGS